MQRYTMTKNNYKCHLKPSVGVVGIFKGYISLRNNNTCFLHHSNFIETEEMCQRSVYIDVSQTEHSILQMKRTVLTVTETF